MAEPVRGVLSPEAPRDPSQASSRTLARSKTDCSIARVSLPVNVFCWLGWYEAITVGQGDALIFSDGRVVRGAWRRDEATAPIEYVDASTGNPLSILPGRTWIELPREGDTTLR